MAIFDPSVEALPRRELIRGTSIAERLVAAARGNRAAVAAVSILVLVIGASVLGPLIYRVNPLAVDPQAILKPPSAAHPFGTDEYGRDILARVLAAGRLDLFIAFAVTVPALVAGTVLGTLAAYLGGIFEEIIMRLVDVLLTFPSFILVMAIVSVLGNEVRMVVAAISLGFLPLFIRLTRGEVVKIRESEYIEAARVVGNSRRRVVLFHILPNAIAPSVVLASIALGWAILTASGLGFLGIGIRPPTSDWGSMVADGAQYLSSGQWWTWLFPGLAVLVVVIAFNWLGDGLRDVLRSG